ncbi:hypothetical protein CRUP_033681 [Coryphaenoides rupestris]|nr:hypothetical protein CRUP_033681 [Coryphaenoides rupestris]
MYITAPSSVQAGQPHPSLGGTGADVGGARPSDSLRGASAEAPPLDDRRLPRVGRFRDDDEAVRVWLSCGVLGRLACGEKSSASSSASAGPVSVATASSLLLLSSSSSSLSPSSSSSSLSSSWPCSRVIFRFLPPAAPGEKKERMSCCRFFSNWETRENMETNMESHTTTPPPRHSLAPIPGLSFYLPAP